MVHLFGMLCTPLRYLGNLCQITATVARLLHFWSQIVISVAKKTMKTKGKYKEKQRALLKVWLQKCSNLATVITAALRLI